MVASKTMPMALGHCAQDYARSLADPWEGPVNACIPDFPALMTGRFRTFARGTFSTSTQAPGMGFIWVDPLSMAANDGGGILLTDSATFSGQTFVVANTVTINSNSPYTVAQLSSNTVSYRLVSAGIRLKAINPDISMGGNVVGLHDPAHLTLLNGNIPYLLSYIEGKQFPLTKEKWTSLLYRPVDTDDNDFVRGARSPASTAGYQGWFMGFLITSFDTSGGTPQSFEYEVVANIEMQGAIVTNKLPSHVDPVGHGAVNAVSAQSKALHSPHQEDGGVLQKAVVSAADHYASTNTTGHQAHKPPPASHVSLWDSVLKYAPSVIGGLMSFL